MHGLVNRRAALALLAAAATPAIAQSQGQAIRILAGYAPGGNVDVLARIFAKSLSDALGRPVIVENRPGGGGQLAAEMLKNAPADGSVLMMAPDAAAVVRPAGMKKPAFDPRRDFVAVAETGAQDYAFAVPANLPVRDLREFTAWTQAHPKEANYGSAGVGGITHMGSILIARELGVPLQHVPYNGSAPAVMALVGGQVTSTFQPVGTLAAQAQAGKVRLLAVSGTKRNELFPDVPTFAELGHTSLKIVTWFGLFAPAKTPADIVNRYNGIIVQAMRQPAIVAQMKTMGLDVHELSAAQFGEQVKADMERWTNEIRAAGIQLDE
jgi:tripartite-type tricarboxylate transporter receptor subunit TctC